MTDRVRYDQDSIENELAQMSNDEIDGLPFGVIKIDRLGNILQYNETESRLAGRKVKDVVGRNFFREIAPCTRHPSFLGRFLEGRDKGELDVKFQYLFDFHMEPAQVTIRIRHSITDKHYWLLISWRTDLEEELDYSVRPEVDDKVAERLVAKLGTGRDGDAFNVE